MRSYSILLAALMCLHLCGCGGVPPMVPVSGVVTVDGKPMAHVQVGFLPDTEEFDPTRHGSGLGVTDAQGNYVVKNAAGQEGLWPGKYKVTFTLMVDKLKKQPLPYDAKPSEVPGGVTNMLPTRYELPGSTPESVAVPAEGLKKDFALAGK